MDVVVTGSSGLIGTALLDELRHAGHRPIRMVRTETAGGDAIRWDPDRGTIDAAGLEGVDAVVHLAGAGIGDRRWTPERKRLVRESRMRSTALLAETLARLQRPPKVLVTASGINHYGDRGDAVLTEDEPPATTFLARLVVDWEGATRPAADAGIRVAFARSGMVLSPRGGALARMLPLFRFGLGGRFGNGRQYWSWISLPDEVRAFVFVLEHDMTGPVNFTAPEPVTNAQFTKTLARVLRRPAVVPVPAFGPKLLVGAELAQELLFTSARIVPRKLLDAGFRFEHADLESALRAVLDA
ncbi:MAG TPA: TIGR01777 family oxidoreductase [Acidimicrobiales bacterium]